MSLNKLIPPLVDTIKTLLTAYPEAAMTRDRNGKTPLHLLCGNDDGKENNLTPIQVSLIGYGYKYSHEAKMLSQLAISVPTVHSTVTMFVFYSTIFENEANEDDNEKNDEKDNIFTKLRIYCPHILSGLMDWTIHVLN
eukprot:gene6660-13482_t